MAPEGPDLVLPTNVPHIKLDVLVGHRFYIEADGRDGRHILVKLEVVENCCP